MSHLIFKVEHVEADLEDLDFVIFEAGAVVDGRKVDALERLLLAHDDDVDDDDDVDVTKC